MAIKLTDLLKALEEEGVVGDKAEEAVERFMAMRASSRGGALAKRDGRDGLAVLSAQEELGRGRPSVDYGDETPEEAKERWLHQEMNDPDGVFGGGGTGGGIFGGDPIALDNYDPGARRRTAEVEHLRAATTEKVVMVKVLAKLAERLGIGDDELDGLLGDGGAGPRRRLTGRGR